MSYAILVYRQVRKLSTVTVFLPWLTLGVFSCQQAALKRHDVIVMYDVRYYRYFHTLKRQYWAGYSVTHQK